jgi:hypothetical protein
MEASPVIRRTGSTSAQCGGARDPASGYRPQELAVCGLRCRRRTRGNGLHPGRNRKANGVDPESYLRTVIARIADHPMKRIVNFSPGTSPLAVGAVVTRRLQINHGEPDLSGVMENDAERVS